jgi:hypothetical protein
MLVKFLSTHRLVTTLVALLARAALRANSVTAENVWLLAILIATSLSLAQTLLANEVLPSQTNLLHTAALLLSSVGAAVALFTPPNKKTKNWVYNPFFGKSRFVLVCVLILPFSRRRRCVSVSIV